MNTEERLTELEAKVRQLTVQVAQQKESIHTLLYWHEKMKKQHSETVDYIDGKFDSQTERHSKLDGRVAKLEGRHGAR